MKKQIPRKLTQERELTDELIDFLRSYYREDIGQLAQYYPKEQKSLHVNYSDVYRFDPDIAQDLKDNPETFLDYFEEALRLFDLPVNVDFSDAHVRVHNLPGEDVYDVEEVTRNENIGSLLGVHGQVQKVSEVKLRVEKASFECQRCGSLSQIPQTGDQLQTPHECQGCELQGPFRLRESQSSWIDHQLARIQQPPERTKGGEGGTIDVHLADDLIDTEG